MRDWKAAVITWEKRDGNRGPQRPAKTVLAQQYDQRDYSDVQRQIEEQNDREIEEALRKKYGDPVNGVWGGTG